MSKEIPNSVLLKFDHGLGDAVQFQVVLRHLSRGPMKDRPIYVECGHGKEWAVGGYALPRRKDDPDSAFSEIKKIDWWEGDRSYGDCPSTKAERCLTEDFGIKPQKDLCGYFMGSNSNAAVRAIRYYKSIGAAQDSCSVRCKMKVCLFHYQGNTSQDRKDLPHDVVRMMCERAQDAGFIPVILDWDDRSTIVDNKRIFRPDRFDKNLWLLHEKGMGDAETITELIRNASFVVAIDSGPGHIAGGTDTPTAIIWTGHHPVRFYGIAGNVTHFVPRGCEMMVSSVEHKFFCDNYRHVAYETLSEAANMAIDSFVGKSSSKYTVVSGVKTRNRFARQDIEIVRDIVDNDAYKLRIIPGIVEQAKTIVDVGAHIGSFAVKAHKLNPGAKIACVEAAPGNWDVLRDNVGSFATIFKAACTYEKGELGLCNAVHDDSPSTGGSVVIPKDGSAEWMKQPAYRFDKFDEHVVEKVTLEQIMEKLGVDRIDLLKLDCEGAEMSIMSESSSMDRVRFIVGEWHDGDRFEKMRAEKFASWPFGIMNGVKGQGIGVFHMSNPVWPPKLPSKIPVHAAGTPATPAIDDSVFQPGSYELKSSSPSSSEKRFINVGGWSLSGEELFHVGTPVIAKSNAPLRVAIPAGIGDAIWVLTKMESLLKREGRDKVDLVVCRDDRQRSKQFLESFSFVNSVSYCDFSIVESDEITPVGLWNYAPSQPGWHGFDWMLQANGHLERGKRLEDWMPELDINWNVVLEHSSIMEAEIGFAESISNMLGSYVCLYFGPREANSIAGQNRGKVWSDQDWVALQRLLSSRGFGVVAVGAPWDLPFFSDLANAGIRVDVNLIGCCDISRTLQVCRYATAAIGYQSGITIAMPFMGRNGAAFWRRYGDSCFHDRFLSFDERMSHCWVDPKALKAGSWLPLIYGRSTPELIAAWVGSINGFDALDDD